MTSQIENLKEGVSDKVEGLTERVDYFKEGLSGRVGAITEKVDYIKGEVVGRVDYLKTMSADKIDLTSVRYELSRNIERVDYEFNRKIHIFLLSIFLILSTFFIVSAYLTFGTVTMLYAIVVFTVALVGENMISRTGSYSYNMEHRPIVGKVPLFIPFLWLAINLGSLFISYKMLSTIGNTNGLHIALISAMIPLFIDLLLLEPKLSKDRKVWVWQSTTKLYAPYGNYVVWFAFPFLMNLAFLIFM